jgi:hypothetical protein
VFVRQVVDFARKNKFHIHIGRPTPDPDSYSIQMSRRDVLILVVNPFKPTEFRIDAYANSDVTPSGPTVDKFVGTLEIALKSVGDCKNVNLNRK